MTRRHGRRCGRRGWCRRGRCERWQGVGSGPGTLALSTADVRAFWTFPEAPQSSESGKYGPVPAQQRVRLVHPALKSLRRPLSQAVVSGAGQLRRASSREGATHCPYAMPRRAFAGGFGMG